MLEWVEQLERSVGVTVIDGRNRGQKFTIVTHSKARDPLRLSVISITWSGQQGADYQPLIPGPHKLAIILEQSENCTLRCKSTALQERVPSIKLRPSMTNPAGATMLMQAELATSFGREHLGPHAEPSILCL